MTYAQIKSGLKLHIVYEPGEGVDDAHLTKAGYLSAPLCNARVGSDGYRMTINYPLKHACKNCLRICKSRHGVTP